MNELENILTILGSTRRRGNMLSAHHRVMVITLLELVTSVK